jgi:hypothetical protein
MVADFRTAASHLLPWACEHVRGESSGNDLTCKRPNLLPVT